MQWMPGRQGRARQAPTAQLGRRRRGDVFRSRARTGTGRGTGLRPGPPPRGAAGGATGRQAAGRGPAYPPSAAAAGRRPGRPAPPSPRARPGTAGPGPTRPAPGPRSGEAETAVSAAHRAGARPGPAAHLDLVEGQEEGEGLVEVGGGCALPGRRPPLLPLPPVQQELDLHVGLWAGDRGQRAVRAGAPSAGPPLGPRAADTALTCQPRAQAAGLQHRHGQLARAGHVAEREAQLPQQLSLRAPATGAQRPCRQRAGPAAAWGRASASPRRRPGGPAGARAPGRAAGPQCPAAGAARPEARAGRSA